MDTENVQEQEEVVVQEEVTTTEEPVESKESQETEDNGEETVVLSKSEFKRLQRRSLAYGATKNSTPKENVVLNISPERLERIELAQEGYSRDEVDAIMELGGSKALKNPIVKSAIDNMRAKEKSKNASTAPSSKSPVFQKYTQEDLSKMSASELEKILPRD